MELLMELVYQEADSGKNASWVFPNTGSGSGRAKEGMGMSKFSQGASVLLVENQSHIKDLH